MSKAKVHQKDAFDFLRTLPSNSIDLLVSSPPYFVGKSYDRSRSLSDFKLEMMRIGPQVERVIRPGGSVCWQVGNHVDHGRVTPLDSILISQLADSETLVLRNRIVWTFGHGTHAASRFSGRHETILWYSKGEQYYFDLDSVRVAQKYPGKRYYKGPRKGEWSGNPKGKNPGDVWDIPNVKAKHIEKTEHPCQFPVALVRRLVLALCPSGGTVIDPYMGSGSTGVAALVCGRNFEGTDTSTEYVEIARQRLKAAQTGNAKFREDAPVRTPVEGEAVARMPGHFQIAKGGLEYG